MSNKKESTENFSKIASDKFDEICPKLVKEFESKFNSEDEEEITKRTKEFSVRIKDTFSKEFPDCKIISHIIALQKGNSSMIESLTLHWDPDNDAYKVYMYENDFFTFMIYVMFIPTEE